MKITFLGGIPPPQLTYSWERLFPSRILYEIIEYSRIYQNILKVWDLVFRWVKKVNQNLCCFKSYARLKNAQNTILERYEVRLAQMSSLQEIANFNEEEIKMRSYLLRNESQFQIKYPNVSANFSSTPRKSLVVISSLKIVRMGFLSRGPKKGNFLRSTYTRLGGSPIQRCACEKGYHGTIQHIFDFTVGGGDFVQASPGDSKYGV